LLKNGYHEFNYRIIARNGEVKHLKTNAWYQLDGGQSFVMTCFQKDVTAQMESGNHLKMSVQRHHCISDIAITLNSTDDFDQKLRHTIDKMGSLLQADQTSLYEIAGNQMVCRFIWAKQDPVIPPGIVLKVPPLNHLPEYINTLHFTEGDAADGFMRCWERPANVQSLLIVPIRIKQKMFGFVEIISKKKRKWKNEDFSFTGTVGNIMANFYDRKNINDELNLNYLNKELLANVSFKLNQYNEDSEHALKNILGYIGMNHPGTERVYVYVYDGEQNLFKQTYDYIHPAFHSDYKIQKKYDGSLFVNILPSLNEGKTFWINHVSQHDTELCKLFHSLGIKSILIAPLFVDGRFYGVFGFSNYSHDRIWKKSEIEMTQALAGCFSHFIERQLMMKKLKNSEKKIKDISAKLPGCMFQISLSPNEDITVDYISPQFEQWSGIKPPSKLLLKNILPIVHPNDQDAFVRVKKDVERFHTEISFEGRIYFPSVGFKWLIVKATMQEIKPSGDLVYNGLLMDKTDSKQTESKLADADTSIQSIINNMEAGVLLVDDYNNVLYSNNNMKKLLGAEFCANTDPSGILDATFQLVRDSVALRCQTKDMMKKRLEERDRELFFCRTAEFFTRDYIPVFRDRFFAHLFIFKNVTQFKFQELEVQKSYKRVRTIIEHSDVGVVLLGENEKVLILNNQFLRTFQIKDPASDFVNQTFRILWDKMCENVYIDGINRDEIRDTVFSGKRIINKELLINNISTVQCFIEPVVYNSRMQKEVHETLIQVVDITSQRNIEVNLLKAKEEAEAIAKAKSHILASMSHEIRTPLNGILSFSAMLKDSLSDPYHHEMAEIIEQSGHRLLNTMDAILDYSMLQSEKKSFKITSVNINHILHEQINVHRAMALQKGLYLYAEIKGVIGIAIADQVLYKILHNLINNAIKYTITGGVKVEADIVPIEGNEWLDLKVIDTGVGIDEFKHRTIFEPFRQESEGYGRAFEGSGLGLSLVKEYVQKMNGKIHLASRKDEGSTFTILLPNAYYENNERTAEIIGTAP
jgi:signal transduction histidine kinase/GAF domain-containing protein